MKLYSNKKQSYKWAWINIARSGVNSSELSKGAIFSKFFRAVFSAVVKGDGRTVGEEILAQSEQQCENPQEFINEIEKVVVTARSQLSLAKIDVSDLLNRVFNVLRWHQVKMEPNFTSVIIAIMVLEGLGRTLDPEMDLLWAAAPFLVKDRLFS